MKNKRLLFVMPLLTVGLVVTTVPMSVLISKANNSSQPRTLSTEITATSPGDGSTISYLPEALSEFWQLEDLLNTYSDQASTIKELTPYTDEMASFQRHMGSSESEKAILRSIFDKYDIYRPTNNVVAWSSSINAKNYRVIISQDKSFSTIEREYTVSGSENSVIFDNPYTGTNYYWQVIATKNDNSLVYSDIFNFTVANLPRTVNIEGVSNTRDLGGNVGLNGKRMKQGLLYRGMGLDAITSDGAIEFKNNLGITTEIDLRGMGEGTENYLNLPNYYHCPSPYDYIDNPTTIPYINYTGDGSLIATFGNAIKALSNVNNYPAYFHCAVGRDRTGWLGMTLNYLCGVSEEVILKEFCLSLFSTSGGLPKGHLELYNRFNRIRNYLNTFNGNNMSEKMEDYLVTMAGVTHEECERVRKILLGDIDTGFVPGTVNPDSYEDLVKVTFRRYGQTPVIKMVQAGSLIEEPNISGNGAWYHGDHLWDFEHDVVTEDMYLDYLSNDKYKVVVHYSGINMPDDVFDVDDHTNFDLTIFDRDGYTYKVYDDSYNLITSLVVTSDVSINVVYTPTSGYIPKSNSRIIVMAGQSNGAGVGHYEYLNNSLTEDKIAEINNGYDNVLLTGYSHGLYLDGFRKVYADKRSMTGGTNGTFGFEVGLADRLSKVFPDETTYIVKYAYGGSSLNHDWISPTGRENIEVVPAFVNGYDRGWLYDGLETSMNYAIEVISQATNAIPMVEAFMWMQGEADADLQVSTDLYLTTFNMLIDDFTTTFADNISYKFAVYDAAISETSIWPLCKQMNSIKRSRVDDHNVYIETNDRLTTRFEPMGTYTDEAHYDAACYIDLGHMFADAYLGKTIKGYIHNAIEIEAPAKVTLKLGQDYIIDTPTVLFNGVVCPAKVSYFAQQYKRNDNTVYAYFVVNDDNSFTPTRVGTTQLRITAYYNDEVRTVLIPVEVVS